MTEITWPYCAESDCGIPFKALLPGWKKCFPHWLADNPTPVKPPKMKKAPSLPEIRTWDRPRTRLARGVSTVRTSGLV